MIRENFLLENDLYIKNKLLLIGHLKLLGQKDGFLLFFFFFTIQSHFFVGHMSTSLDLKIKLSSLHVPEKDS